MRYLSFLFCSIFLSKSVLSQEKVLLFVSHEETYYSEYIVALKAFEAAGYEVDVRSSTSQAASTYMIPASTTIEETANTLPGSSYADFTTQFQASFGSNWEANFNIIPSQITTNGSIHDVQNMDEYAAFVLAGGTGILAYRVDGSYQSQGTGNRLISAQVVQSTAEKLNALALDALSKGKVVLAQCHGASLPVFWRIPNTNGTGAESLGISLLKNERAAGYPQTQTGTDYTTLNVDYSESARVHIASPNPQFTAYENAKSRLITSRDWYPQTVSYACRSVLNILESYPTQNELVQDLSILVLHGGAIDPNNCHYTNRANDIPCNYGAGTNLPADYTDLVAVLNANSTQDSYTFSVTDLNITSTNLPFNPSNEASISSYLSQFDGIVFYKHWSTGLTTELQQAIVNFVDNGGGILGLHHGLYNDIDGSLNKNILINELFGVSSEMNTWSANLTDFQLFNTNYGHFVTSYQIQYQNPDFSPNQWSSNALLNGSNASFSTYHQFSIYDEIYNNLLFKDNQSFGRNVNQILPLFSNNLNPSAQVHASGFVKEFNENADDKIGKLAYFIVGERKESISMNHTFGQVIRNAVCWTAQKAEELTTSNTNPVSNPFFVYPNPVNDQLAIQAINPIQQLVITDLLGKVVLTAEFENETHASIDLNGLKQGAYIVEIYCNDTKFVKKIVKKD